MAKQKYEEKKGISLCGLLAKNKEGQYIVTVEEKDSLTRYDLADILAQMEGSVISLTSAIF